MPYVRTPGLVRRLQTLLDMTQEELARVLRTSRRSIIRWKREEADGAPVERWIDVAHALYPHSRVAAEHVATTIGETLVSLGLEAAPPVPPRTPADLVVLTGAEAADASPHAIRRALLAALDHAAAIGMSRDDLRAALRGVTRS